MPAKGARQLSPEAPASFARTESATREPRRAHGGDVALRGVTHAFRTRRGELTALEDLTLEVHAGEILGVVGPSGCGKSTLLELVCGLQEPSAGSVTLDGHADPAERLRRAALMPQRDLLLPWRTALDNAALALELHGIGRREARRLALPLFEHFGLASFADARPDELSGGMRQRVSFARTLLAGKPVLLLDEPFGSLDSITRAELQEWLAVALEGEPRTALLVTHDVEEALFLCDRVLVLSPRPGTLRAELTVDRPRARPRRERVTSPEFAALRERALEALT
jgi:ABC-type nitrate/sulfonate/bicarbonate transport system ATPase subunit